MGEESAKVKRILIWEWDSAVRELNYTWLMGEGYKCTKPTGLSEALALIEENNYDLVISCWRGHGGNQVIAKAKNCDIPVLCYSGESKVDIPIKDIDYIAKPCGRLGFIEAVRKMLDSIPDEGVV